MKQSQTPLLLADRVWHQTVPTLQKHRLRRYLLRSGAAALLLIALILSLWPSDVPAEYRWVSYDGPDTDRSLTSSSPSLAVLVVDSNGARFEQFQAEELTAEGLHFDFTFRPVITDSFGYFF